MNVMTNTKAPQWYSTEEIRAAIVGGRFFAKGKTVEESIALHLQAALEKGFDMGKRADVTSENVRLREALKARVMVWNDPSDRNYHLCDLCGKAEDEKHDPNCVLA